MQPADREYAAWLGGVERHVILPLKWLLFLLSGGHWLWVRGGTLPGTEAFALFFFFVAFTLAEQYFFARDRVTPSQVRPFVYVSFMLDALFVAGMVLLDHVDRVGAAGPLDGISDYTVLFAVVVLRGFALFRTESENVYGFLFASGLFALTGWLQIKAGSVLAFPQTVRELAFVWGIMMIAQAFVGLLNRRKEEEFRTRERIIRSASLASLGDLAAGVAHEINNPIGIIKTYADYLIQSTPPDSSIQEDFTAIRSEAERCQVLVRRMLDFSNPQIEGFAPVDMDALVREVTGFVFHEGIGEPIDAVVESAAGLPRVSGDPVQLKQAVINVLVNARQILTDYRQSDKAPEAFRPRVEVELSRGVGPRPPVRLTVRDNGPGLSQAEADRVFEPFFSRRAKGTGLGLAITRRIVEAHHGTISIAPHPAGGAVVTIDLPMEGEEGG